MTTNLKVLISAAGLAILAASPVLAASHARQHASAPAASNVVSPNGKVIGTDPDIQIRSEMQRDSMGAGGVGNF